MQAPEVARATTVTLRRWWYERMRVVSGGVRYRRVVGVVGLVRLSRWQLLLPCRSTAVRREAQRCHTSGNGGYVISVPGSRHDAAAVGGRARAEGGEGLWPREARWPVRRPPRLKNAPSCPSRAPRRAPVQRRWSTFVITLGGRFAREGRGCGKAAGGAHLRSSGATAGDACVRTVSRRWWLDKLLSAGRVRRLCANSNTCRRICNRPGS